MIDCLRQIAFDIDSVELELKRYQEPNKRIKYLQKIESIAWDVYSDVDNVIEQLETHIEKSTQKRNTPLKPLDIASYKFIKSKISKIDNDDSKILLNCIADLTLGKSLMQTDLILEQWINKIGAFRDDLFGLLNSEQSNLKRRDDNALEQNDEKIFEKGHAKIDWLKDESSIIEVFNKLMDNGFIARVADLHSNIALHFNVQRKILLPKEGSITFHKLNWIKAKKDLIIFYKKLIDKNIIEHHSSKHLLLVNHFSLRGQDLKLKSTRNFYNKITTNEYLYQPTQTLVNIIDDVPWDYDKAVTSIW